MFQNKKLFTMLKQGNAQERITAIEKLTHMDPDQRFKLKIEHLLVNVIKTSNNPEVIKEALIVILRNHDINPEEIVTILISWVNTENLTHPFAISWQEFPYKKIVYTAIFNFIKQQKRVDNKIWGLIIDKLTKRETAMYILRPLSYLSSEIPVQYGQEMAEKMLLSLQELLKRTNQGKYKFINAPHIYVEHIRDNNNHQKNKRDKQIGKIVKISPAKIPENMLKKKGELTALVNELLDQNYRSSELLTHMDTIRKDLEECYFSYPHLLCLNLLDLNLPSQDQIVSVIEEFYNHKGIYWIPNEFHKQNNTLGFYVWYQYRFDFMEAISIAILQKYPDNKKAWEYLLRLIYFKDVTDIAIGSHPVLRLEDNNFLSKKALPVVKEIVKKDKLKSKQIIRLINKLKE